MCTKVSNLHYGTFDTYAAHGRMSLLIKALAVIQYTNRFLLTVSTYVRLHTHIMEFG